MKKRFYSEYRNTLEQNVVVSNYLCPRNDFCNAMLSAVCYFLILLIIYVLKAFAFNAFVIKYALHFSILVPARIIY